MRFYYIVRVLGELLYLHRVGIPVHHPGLRLLQVFSLPETGLLKLRPRHLAHRHDHLHSVHGVLAHTVS